MQPVPYRRLSAFYFFYLAVLGGFMPYWSLYLVQQLHFTPALIGQLMAVTVVTRLIAPNFWGWLADRSGRRLPLVRLGLLMLVLLWSGMPLVSSFGAMAGMLLVYSFFQNAILAQFEAVTITHLGERRAQYGTIRLWGSLGFIAAVTGLGGLFDVISLHWLPLLLAGLALAAWLTSLSVPDVVSRSARQAPCSLGSILRKPAVLGFLGAGFLLQISHAPYNTFYSVFLESHHYSRTCIGWLWALGAAAEVAAFTQMHRLLPWLGERRVLLAALLLSALRWLVIGQAVDHPGWLAAMQLLHAASFAAVHSASISLIHRHFGDGHQGQGQALYGMLWGLAAALGSYGAGQWWAVMGPDSVFTMAAGVSLVACAWLWIMTHERGSVSKRRPLAAGAGAHAMRAGR